MNRNPEPVVRYRDGRALADLRSLATLTGRSARTIREHCPVVQYATVGRERRALYDADQCGAILATIPTRTRTHSCAKVARAC